MAEGWIKLHRQIQDSEIWAGGNEPFDRRSAWIDLLMLANHEDKRVIFDYNPLIIKRGQYLTSVRELANRWKWGKDRVLKFLKLLERLGMVTKDSNNKRTLLTVVKYGDFQDAQDTDKDTGKDTEQTQIRTQNRHRSATNNNVKNERNNKESVNKTNKESVNNNKYIYYPNDMNLNQAFIDYISMRKQIKKPMSDRAIDLAIKKLNELSGGDNDLAIEILNQSIMNSWQGLFELKKQTKTQTIDWSKV